MAYIVTLNKVGRQRQPKIGSFLWSPEHGRFAWKGKTLISMEELAEAVNEAIPFLKLYDNPFLEMSVIPVNVAPVSTKPKKLTLLPK